MTVIYRADVFCDHCANWLDTEVSGPRKDGLASQAVAKAKKAGWSRDTKSIYMDLCPSCAEGYRRGEFE